MQTFFSLSEKETFLPCSKETGKKFVSKRNYVMSQNEAFIHETLFLYKINLLDVEIKKRNFCLEIKGHNLEKKFY